MIYNNYPFRVGEVYLFHKSDPQCNSTTSLWGIFDKQVDGRVYLEACTKNLSHFERWVRLPSDYSYCRKSSRTELRDFMTNMVLNELGEL